MCGVAAFRAPAAFGQFRHDFVQKEPVAHMLRFSHERLHMIFKLLHGPLMPAVGREQSSAVRGNLIGETHAGFDSEPLRKCFERANRAGTGWSAIVVDQSRFCGLSGR